METHKAAIIKLIEKYQTSFHPIIPGLKKQDLLTLDFTENSPYLKELDLKDTLAFHHLIFDEVLKGKVGIGGFFEDRIIYRRSSHYDGAEPRSLHLGLDIWAPAGTKLNSPLGGQIHSLQDNQGFGNYGPTLILEHHLEEATFYVLYGHLDGKTLEKWKVGDPVAPGEYLGDIGNFPENGDWPPHLHWQVMTDMLGHVGDFPGVAATSDRKFYLQLCIDPHYILRLAE